MYTFILRSLFRVLERELIPVKFIQHVDLNEQMGA